LTNNWSDAFRILSSGYMTIYSIYLTFYTLLSHCCFIHCLLSSDGELLSSHGELFSSDWPTDLLAQWGYHNSVGVGKILNSGENSTQSYYKKIQVTRIRKLYNKLNKYKKLEKTDTKRNSLYIVVVVVDVSKTWN